MIVRGAMDGDSNWVQKRHSRTKCTVFKTPKVELRPILGFEPNDLEGVATPYNDTLIIRVIITNFDMTRIFVDADNSINVHRTYGGKYRRLITYYYTLNWIF